MDFVDFCMSQKKSASRPAGGLSFFAKKAQAPEPQFVPEDNFWRQLPSGSSSTVGPIDFMSGGRFYGGTRSLPVGPPGKTLSVDRHGGGGRGGFMFSNPTPGGAWTGRGMGRAYSGTPFELGAPPTQSPEHFIARACNLEGGCTPGEVAKWMERAGIDNSRFNRASLTPPGAIGLGEINHGVPTPAFAAPTHQSPFHPNFANERAFQVGKDDPPTFAKHMRDYMLLPGGDPTNEYHWANAGPYTDEREARWTSAPQDSLLDSALHRAYDVAASTPIGRAADLVGRSLYLPDEAQEILDHMSRPRQFFGPEYGSFDSYVDKVDRLANHPDLSQDDRAGLMYARPIGDAVSRARSGYQAAKRTPTDISNAYQRLNRTAQNVLPAARAGLNVMGKQFGINGQGLTIPDPRRISPGLQTHNPSPGLQQPTTGTQVGSPRLRKRSSSGGGRPMLSRVKKLQRHIVPLGAMRALVGYLNSGNSQNPPKETSPSIAPSKEHQGRAFL